MSHTWQLRCPAFDKGRTHVRRFASHMGTQPAKASPSTQLPKAGKPANRSRVMPFEKIGDESLDAVVNVRLTREEKERLRDDADMAAL